MKIGIITFHWATNYGAVLQCYALQEYLKQCGHDVSVINYKPSKYDNNIWTFFRMKKFMNIGKFLADLKKEKRIKKFREKYLNVTQRYFTIKQLQKYCNQYDAIITGSDQVLNYSFLQGAERGGSTAYYLNFGQQTTLRICYAVSFGTTLYPKDLVPIVTPLVKRLNSISCRENTGVEIFNSFGVKSVEVVPDPTLLLRDEDYIKLLPWKVVKHKKDFVYLLHGRYRLLSDAIPTDAIISESESIEQWLLNIASANLVITNSFHCAVFCIHFHVPFWVVLPSLQNKGMNDRFYTMLTKFGLTNRMVSEKDFVYSNEININWQKVDTQLNNYSGEGKTFLYKAFNCN